MRSALGPLLLLVFTSAFNSVGQLLMRWGGNQRASNLAEPHRIGQWALSHRWWLVGIMVSWFAGLGWALCLRSLPLAFALPLYTGLVYLLSLLGAAVFLKEQVSAIQVIGMASILSGVVLLALSAGVGAVR